MAFDSDVLLQRLQVLMDGARPRRWLVALSGGIDSTVLLHALVRADSGIPVIAVHVDHGLHPDSGHWLAHAEAQAKSLAVEFVAMAVTVDRESASGLEAAAREARYRALESLVLSDDWLLSGHHENDQAETLLLNLMRGSGPAGLAGIGARNEFGAGMLARPLLGVAGEDIRTYAERHSLEWIDDPANEDPGFDRNFVRHEVMSLLKSRWPAVASRLRQSAELAGEADGLLRELADLDITACGGPSRLSIPAMHQLAPARLRNMLRRAVWRCGLPSPPATRLQQFIDELLPARKDAQPLVSWQGAELRRYRESVFVLPPLGELPRDLPDLLRPDGVPLALGDGLGQLVLRPGADGGIDPDIAEPGLSVRFRAGGESIRVAGEGATRKLKKLLQEAEVLPWMRDRVPLLFAGEDLVAVGDLWVSAAHATGDGLAVEWREKPAII